MSEVKTVAPVKTKAELTKIAAEEAAKKEEAAKTTAANTAVKNPAATSTPRTGLSNRPNFTNYVKSQPKTKAGVSIGNPFNKRYYSQCDAEIFFGDTYIDEIVDLTFTEQQNSQPLFGYNSYTYDEVAQGTRSIQGVFSVNFTSPGYIKSIVDAMVQAGAAKSNVSIAKTAPEGTIAEKAKPAVTASVGSGPVWPKTFEIDLVFGQKTSLGEAVHIVITGVVITGYKMGVDVSGKVAVENYSFIAKDITTSG